MKCSKELVEKIDVLLLKIIETISLINNVDHLHSYVELDSTLYYAVSYSNLKRLNLIFFFLSNTL